MANRYLNRHITDSSDEMFYLDEDDLDTIKTFLAYTLMKNTLLTNEDIYNYIFGDGKKILWN